MDTVQVAVRIRPLVASETSKGCQSILSKTSNSAQIIVNSGKENDMFTYNHVFASDETQEMVYANCVKPIVQKLFQG